MYAGNCCYFCIGINSSVTKRRNLVTWHAMKASAAATTVQCPACPTSKQQHRSTNKNINNGGFITVYLLCALLDTKYSLRLPLHLLFVLLLSWFRFCSWRPKCSLQLQRNSSSHQQAKQLQQHSSNEQSDRCSCTNWTGLQFISVHFMLHFTLEAYSVLVCGQAFPNAAYSCGLDKTSPNGKKSTTLENQF